MVIFGGKGIKSPRTGERHDLQMLQN
ncbi:uncharacterized protein G2W53_027309 [Senna tora]|uniref:Uncharacterized protein n=1 Tax=Senna tora TaxID=362788 RepID=A0A834WM47_9FABA|nr:uncharacterized protein G2W53_027309 [Senna tora]